jgi:predicted O-methyltransferase YrrM
MRRFLPAFQTSSQPIPDLLLGLMVALVLFTSSAAAQVSRTDSDRPTTAFEVSERFLPRHLVPRNEDEKRIVDVMDFIYANQYRGVGSILPEDGRLLWLMTEAIGARHVGEIGTANGYSALWMCLGLRATGGRLTTFELDPERVATARENFRNAGVDDMVEIVEGDAHETLSKLEGPIDLFLLDSEKSDLPAFLEKILPLMRPGGLILAHDSTGQPLRMQEYFEMINANPDLETVFVDASPWGMAITLKRR